MGQPRRNPQIIFSDVLPIWEKIAEHNGGRLPVRDAKQATYLVHRMNRARRILRDSDPDGLCLYDRFVVRAQGDEIVATLRNNLDTSAFVGPTEDLGLEDTGD